MAKKIGRGFSSGHHSELLYNEELYRNYEATKHLLDKPEDGSYPTAKVDGAIWRNPKTNELCYYDASTHTWVPFFDNVLQIIRELTSELEPENPIKGQLWLCDGILYAFNGSIWEPVKAGLSTDSQFNISSFNNFVMASPLWVIGNMTVKDKNTNEAVDAIDFLKKKEDLRERYRQAKFDIPNNSYVVGHTKQMPVYATDKDGNILDGYGKPVYDVKDNKGKVITKGSGKDPEIIRYEEMPEEWNPKDHSCGPIGADIPEDLELDKYAQFIAPNIDIDRVFLDDRLDKGYERRSSVHFNYEISKLLDSHKRVKTPSLIHINPGKLTGIRKRLFKVNKLSPSIKVNPSLSEFYGFYRYNRYGHFLRPVDKNGTGDYVIQNGGIFLSQSGREYDFVIALTYEYGWLSNTGHMSITQANAYSPTFYVGAHDAGAANVFVNGFSLEDNSFLEDNKSMCVAINNVRTTDEITGVLYNTSREYGFIREVLPDVRSSDPAKAVPSQGVIHLANKYISPLVFVNGLLLPPNSYVYDSKRNLIFVNNADIEQPWTVIDAYDSKHKFNSLLAKGNVEKDGEIAYTTKEEDFASDDNFVLFVDGLLISHDNIRRDHKNHVLYVDGIKGEGKNGVPGQEYVLLRDRYKSFFSRQELTPAVGVGNVNQALIYCNGLYVGDYTQCLTTMNESAMSAKAEDNEIFFFADGGERGKGNTFYRTTQTRSNNWFRDELEKYVTMRRKGFDAPLPFEQNEIAGSFKIFNKADKRFETFDAEYAMQLIYMSDNYDILPHDVALSFSYGDSDDITIYSFRYAHDQGKHMTIGTLPQGDIQDPANAAQAENLCYSLYKTDKAGKWVLDEHGLPVPAEGAVLMYGKADVATQTIKPVMNDGKGMTFKLKNGNFMNQYEPNIGALSVWVNGIRQSDIIENTDGISFTIPQPVYGQVQYCIESRREGGDGVLVQQEVLDNNNVVPGCVNVYKTEKPLFPGVVTIYIDGIRQSQSRFSIIDCNTLMINDDSTQLVGSDGNNWPVETFAGVPDVNGGSKWASIDHTKFRYSVKEGDPEYPYWGKPHNEGDPNPMPSKILVEVRQDFDRVEKVLNFEERSGGPNDIFVGSSGDFPQVPENILDTSDEVLIFLNGMFYGLAANNGYTLDKNRLEIRIHNNDFIDTVVKDPVYNIMYDENGNKTLAELEFEDAHGYEYKRKNEIILNWR